jgi:membrane protein YdbS with pleckstrin-like domain
VRCLQSQNLQHSQKQEGEVVKVICPACKTAYDIEQQNTPIEAECPCGQTFIVPAAAPTAAPPRYAPTAAPPCYAPTAAPPRYAPTAAPPRYAPTAAQPQPQPIPAPTIEAKKTDAETEIWSGSPSWVYYLSSYLIGILMITSIVLSPLGIIFIVCARLDRRSKIYLITQRRISTQQGIISRLSNEVRIKDIRVINVKQGIFERMAGVGTIEIGTAGHAGIEVRLAGVPTPFELRDKIRSLMDDQTS